MTAWLKAVHIIAIAFWCGSLFVIPGLFAQRGERPHGPDLYRLQTLTRAVYTYVASPSAFIAVATGTGLIFVQNVFTPWFALKLAFVGALVILHVRHGFVILHLYEKDRRYAVWRNVVALTAVTGIATAILTIVLTKPNLDLTRLPAFLREPGALQSLSDAMIPMP